MLSDTDIRCFQSNERRLYWYYGEMCRYICVHCGRMTKGWSQKTSKKIEKIREEASTQGISAVSQHHFPYFFNILRNVSGIDKQRISEWYADSETGLAFGLAVSFLNFLLCDASPEETCFLVGYRRMFTKEECKAYHQVCIQRSRLLADPILKSLKGQLNTSIAPLRLARQYLRKAGWSVAEVEKRVWGRKAAIESFFKFQYPALKRILKYRNDCWIRHSREPFYEHGNQVEPYEDIDVFPQAGRHFIPCPYRKGVRDGRFHDAFAARHSAVPFGDCIVHSRKRFAGRAPAPPPPRQGQKSAFIDKPDKLSNRGWFPQTIMSLTELNDLGGKVRMDSTRDHIAVVLSQPVPWSNWLYLTRNAQDMKLIADFTYAGQGGATSIHNANNIADIADKLAMAISLMGNITLNPPEQDATQEG